MSYQDTSLWKRTLGKDDKNVEPLRESFLDARKNAEFLLDKIRKDFPNLTVHDITHVDSLWNVADTIIGKDYPINPLEGYVLGIAFLIHDAALSYDAVGGKDKLRDTIEWKDAYADGSGDKDEEDFKKECDFAAIRALHARYAEDILNQKFERDNTTTFYIIGNDEYRTQFSDMIGKIAASHHWSIDEVESNLENQINPVAGLPSDWEINEQKLACILRCADAGHIDNGRAPYGIYTSLIVNGVSRDHWESQTRLGQVRENRKNPEQLLITSTRPFDKDNFAAWNVAYDAVRLFDEELKKSNELLKLASLSFPHVGVTGAESKEVLSEYIKTNGWLPCSFGVHTGNVKALIENLGGSKLYGEENMLLVSLRELIQNARDAIHARIKMDSSYKDGKIIIRLKEENGERYIDVEDDGIGMSLDCIKYHLLDFGSSYWKSTLSKKENKGLGSSGFKSIGKYGIGFYSVFMVAKSVEVITRRYEGSNKANKIEFPAGLTLSPIMSRTELSTLMSTIVRFELKDDVNLTFGVKHYDNPISLQKALSILVAGLDVDVYFNGIDECDCLHRSIESPKFDKKKWLGDLFIPCPGNIDEIASKLELLRDENNVIRGLVIPPLSDDIVFKPGDIWHRREPSILTVGGLSSPVLSDNFEYHGFWGYIDGRENSINRNMMVIDGPLIKSLRIWAKENYIKHYDEIVNTDLVAYRYRKLIEFCGLKDEIVNENTMCFYVAMRSGVQVGTMNGLMTIHRYLFKGVDEDAGVLEPLRRNAKITEEVLSKLFDSQEIKLKCSKILNPYFIYDKSKNYKIKKMDLLMQINAIPAISFKEIMHKYVKLAKCHPFKDGNKRALGVWVNLMLDDMDNKMIDWSLVDKYKLDFLIRKGDVVNAEKYLMGFLSSTYVTDLISSKCM
jgi:fido (protein-threonine AMPylation protein)